MNTDFKTLMDPLKRYLTPLVDSVSEMSDSTLKCWISTSHLGCSVEIFIDEHCISVMHQTSTKTTDATSTFRRLLIDLQKLFISILPTRKWYILNPCTATYSNVGFTTDEHLEKALVKTISEELVPEKKCISECFFSPCSISDINLEGFTAFSKQLWEFITTRFMRYVDLQAKAYCSINAKNDKNGKPKYHYFTLRWGSDSDISIMVEIHENQIVVHSDSTNINSTFDGWSFVCGLISEYLKTCPNQCCILKLPNYGYKMTTIDFLAEVWPDDSNVSVNKI